MQTTQHAVRAYAAASAHRSLREQEADVFHRVTAGLRRVREGTTKIAAVRAFADNDRLWLAVIGAARDPENELPATLLASLISVGLAVQREMRHDAPDLEFLITVNENVAAGLSGRAWESPKKVRILAHLPQASRGRKQRAMVASTTPNVQPALSQSRVNGVRCSERSPA